MTAAACLLRSSSRVHSSSARERSRRAGSVRYPFSNFSGSRLFQPAESASRTREKWRREGWSRFLSARHGGEQERKGWGRGRRKRWASDDVSGGPTLMCHCCHFMSLAFIIVSKKKVCSLICFGCPCLYIL